MLRTAALVVIMTTVCACALYADTVVLNDGTEITGTITEQTDDYVRIDSDGTDMLFERAEVESIESAREEMADEAPLAGIGPKEAGIMLGIIGILLLVFILAYVYGSFCLMLIAQKTNNGPVWMAWIPVANLFLLCRIAQVNYWWAGGMLLGGIIPYLGLLAVLGIGAFIWYKVAIARGKPGWLGILTIVPFVNLVVMGILAFSD